MTTPLDRFTPDRNGFIPNPALVGRAFRHAGNGCTYTITGYVYFGDTDEWAVTHKRDDCDVVFSRTVANFFGQRTGPRYTAV